MLSQLGRLNDLGGSGNGGGDEGEEKVRNGGGDEKVSRLQRRGRLRRRWRRLIRLGGGRDGDG